MDMQQFDGLILFINSVPVARYMIGGMLIIGAIVMYVDLQRGKTRYIPKGYTGRVVTK